MLVRILYAAVALTLLGVFPKGSPARDAAGAPHPAATAAALGPRLALAPGTRDAPGDGSAAPDASARACAEP
jgi:hypothetical protein